jgi:hypothetical protein
VVLIVLGVLAVWGCHGGPRLLPLWLMAASRVESLRRLRVPF